MNHHAYHHKITEYVKHRLDLPVYKKENRR